METDELGAQLRKPEGETGIQVGQMMNKGNREICLNAYRLLSPKANDHILEIGMGNGLFIKDLLAMADGLTYVGLDFSPTMIKEATLINAGLIGSGTVKFIEGSLENIPCPDDSFDLITTTNTLYFWPDPKNNLAELKRVLKPGGRLLIAYRSKAVMDTLEFTKTGFAKFDEVEVEDLLTMSGFKDVGTVKITEPEFEFREKMMKLDGIYTTGVKPRLYIGNPS